MMRCTVAHDADGAPAGAWIAARRMARAPSGAWVSGRRMGRAPSGAWVSGRRMGCLLPHPRDVEAVRRSIDPHQFRLVDPNTSPRRLALTGIRAWIANLLSALIPVAPPGPAKPLASEPPRAGVRRLCDATVGFNLGAAPLDRLPDRHLLSSRLAPPALESPA